ncbi:MAG: recombinase family protein [Oscillospiraceae bacterium]|nr:recombinase family protein [Oscillospiraceae bacterium]
MQSKKKQEQIGITALYCRLSRDDGTEGDSDSVANQKRLLQKYAKENGLGNTRPYVDDGFTGTNFNRPGFQKLLEDIDMGYVSTVIVKDMSRLGRDYLQVGYYTDTYFPDRNIRFIAVNDCVDSADGENELAPFRNVMNEMYARDISRKVRSSHRLRGNAGEPLSQPPYGYLKSPENKKKWIIDPEAAQVIRDIYRMCLEGKGNETIARILQDRKILIPMAYWQSKGLGRGSKKTQPNPYKWCKTNIEKILANQEYCGDVINFKTYSKSFKNKARLENPKENWVIFRDVHEPIIDRETFEQVQKLIARTKRRAPKKYNVPKNMFCDLLYCADCGSKLWFRINTVNKDIHYFSCSNYKTDTRGTCETRHYIRADAVEQVVLLELKRLAAYLRADEEGFAELLAQKTNRDILTEQKMMEAELQKAIARNDTVSGLYEKLYEDNVSGKVTDEWFMQLSHKYEVERMELKAKTAKLKERLSSIGKMQQNKDHFISAIRRFMEMEKLTAPLLRELIDRITVYETEGVGKNRSQRIMIHYRFIGYIEIPECRSNYKADTRKGVAVEYITQSA